MKTISCYLDKDIISLLDKHELRQVMHLFQGDTMGNSTCYYYFVKPEVEKLFTDMDFGSNRVEVILKNKNKIDISNTKQKRIGEFNINELISPPLIIRDGYIESNADFEFWVMKYYPITQKMFSNITKNMEIFEEIHYNRIQNVVNDKISYSDVVLSYLDIQKVINDITDVDLKEKVKNILLSEQWKRTEVNYRIY